MHNQSGSGILLCGWFGFHGWRSATMDVFTLRVLPAKGLVHIL